MPNQLHYKGNVKPDDDQLFGPDMFGAMYMVKTIEYDAENDVTTITFKPIVDPSREPIRLQDMRRLDFAELKRIAAK